MSYSSKIAAVLLAWPMALTAMPQTQAQGSQLVCPSGYSLVGEICISDTTGDIVNPITRR
jgi:hypothetical protein